MASITIFFPDHISTTQQRDLLSGIAAYGNVDETESDQEFLIEVFRESNLPKLIEQLKAWEVRGFLRWNSI